MKRCIEMSIDLKIDRSLIFLREITFVYQTDKHYL